MTDNKQKSVFTRYQVFMIAILAILQFTVILDFMVMSPLGAILLPVLKITTSQFGLVVSSYAFSAGVAGLLTAGFADKFDRKKLLLFFYTGFLLGTFFCAIAPTYHFLLLARIVTGLFGGVIGSIGFAIITDLFAINVRGRVMGYVQMAFAASQVLGLPIGLYLANHFGWHSPFWMVGIFGILVGIVIILYMRPIVGHLLLESEHSPLQHLIKTATKPSYVLAFITTTLLATGGFMIMPFGSAFATNNLGLTLDQLPILYGVTGVFSIFFGPFTGRLSDKVGKYKIFVAGSIISAILISVYTRMGVTPLWIVLILNVILFIGITSRMIPASALMTAIPEAKDRGAFMSFNASVQQVSGGIASAIAGAIVYQAPNGNIIHYERLGIVVICTMAASVVMMYFINKMVNNKMHHGPTIVKHEEPVLEAI